tara:strand:- start:107 stop:481 length:375 start_codon:yes stop_codon:yes gene_type:complete
MDDSLHWDIGESRNAIERIYAIDLGLTNLETLLNHGLTLWVVDGKTQYDAPEELDSSRLDVLLKMAATCKSDIVSIISDPDSVRKTLSDAQGALAEAFNHSSILEDDLLRLSAIVKRRNNDHNR